MGEVEEVRWKMKMGQKNNKEEIEVERLTVSFLGEGKKLQQDNGRNKSFIKIVIAGHT